MMFIIDIYYLAMLNVLKLEPRRKNAIVLKVTVLMLSTLISG